VKGCVAAGGLPPATDVCFAASTTAWRGESGKSRRAQFIADRGGAKPQPLRPPAACPRQREGPCFAASTTAWRGEPGRSRRVQCIGDRGGAEPLPLRPAGGKWVGFGGEEAFFSEHVNSFGVRQLIFIIAYSASVCSELQASWGVQCCMVLVIWLGACAFLG